MELSSRELDDLHIEGVPGEGGDPAPGTFVFLIGDR